MTELRESVLAWDLVDNYKEFLTAPEVTAVFVNLGVGEYTAVIHAVLHTFARNGVALSTEMSARVQAWRDCYHQPVQPVSPADRLPL
jgi:hypothetical protein